MNVFESAPLTLGDSIQSPPGNSPENTAASLKVSNLYVCSSCGHATGVYPHPAARSRLEVEVSFHCASYHGAHCCGRVHLVSGMQRRSAFSCD